MDTNQFPQAPRPGPEAVPPDSSPAAKGRARPGRLLLALIIAVVLAIALGGAAALHPWSQPSPSAPTSFAGLATDGFSLGAPGAPVTIDLYEDFQCPICLEWYHQVFPSLRDGALAAGEAKLVFHGLSALGPESAAAARAAYAAGRQGHFWDMWSALYAHQGVVENSGAFSDAALRILAQNLGLDLARYDDDFASPAAADFVASAEADSRARGISGTPTAVIAGVQYPGVGSYADLAAAIDAARPGASPTASH